MQQHANNVIAQAALAAFASHRQKEVASNLQGIARSFSAACLSGVIELSAELSVAQQRSGAAFMYTIDCC